MLGLNNHKRSTNLKFAVLAVSWLFIACTKEVKEVQVYDNVIYHLDTTKLYNSSAEKTKQKTPTQYISIMYSDLFSKTISTNNLAELSELNLAIGDKAMSNELVLSHYLKDGDADLPSNSEMRVDPETFVEATYLRFYQRKPTAYEKLYLVDIINKDASLTVENIYTAFILSNEYYYY